MVLAVQIAGLLFGVFMIYFSFLKFKRKEFNVGEFIFWVVLWAILSTISLVPAVLTPFVQIFSFSRIFDLLIVLGFLFLIALSYFNYVAVRKTSKKLEDLVREVAIKRKK